MQLRRGLLFQPSNERSKILIGIVRYQICRVERPCSDGLAKGAKADGIGLGSRSKICPADPAYEDLPHAVSVALIFV